MKGKFRIFAITFAMVMALLGGMLIAQPAHKAYADEDTKHINFTPVAIYTGNYDNGTAFLLGGTDSPNLQVTVKYKVVANTGINNIVLIPDYDRTAFSIASVIVNDVTNYNITVNENALGTATITGTEKEANYVKIAMDSDTTYEGTDSENTALLTVVFNLSSEAPEGTYSFGLKCSLNEQEQEQQEQLESIYNNKSTAHVYLDGSSLGEQDPVEINIVANNHENEVRVLRMQDANIAIGYSNTNNDYSYNYYEFVYSGVAPEPILSANIVTNSAQYLPDDVTDHTVKYYYYTGIGQDITALSAQQLTLTWYEAEWDYENNEWVKGDALQLDTVGPVNAGEYLLGISASAYDVYRSVEEELRLVRIIPQTILITADNAGHIYGSNPAALTSSPSISGVTVTYTVTKNDEVVTLSSSTPVGTYTITPSVSISGGNPNYSIQCAPGTYTVSALQLLIEVGNDGKTYDGIAATLSNNVLYSVYYYQGNEKGDVYTNASSLDIVLYLTEENLVNAGIYNDVIGAHYIDSANYSITVNNGNYTISSVTGYNFSQFFAGLDKTYNGSAQELLQVTGLPAGITYVVSGGSSKTNAGNYELNITLTLTQEFANNYNNGNTEVVLNTIGASIAQYALTITADNKGHTYGNTPATLTPATAGIGNEVEVTFTVKDGDNTITLATDTNVGSYSIVPSAVNSNYTFTFENGTYTVSKGTPVITVSAKNIVYNRALDYSASALVGTLALNNYSVAFINSNNETVDHNDSVLDADTYTVVVTVAGTDNYNGATNSAEFVISKIALATPSVTYGNNTATWTYPTTDAGSVNLYDVESFTYKIDNGNVVSGSSFTPTSTGVHTLTIYSDNNNYNPVTVNLYEVFSVTFETGTVPATMPNPQYVFNGQTATEPTAPEVTGQTFSGWNKGNSLYVFSTPVTENLTLVAQWNKVKYTLTFVYHDAIEFVSHTFDANHGEVLSLTFENDEIDDVLSRFDKTQNDVKGYDLNGYRYARTNNWKVTETANSTNVIAESTSSVTVTGAWTFTLIYTSSAIEYTLTYMVKEDNGEYAQYGETVSVACDAEINYATLNAVPWFRADAWFADENRLTLAPETMPAGNLTVYGAIVFNIGQGDVNGDGVVNANDIMLYRQWIVGGYTMTVVAKGSEFATATAQTYNSNTRYFLTKVADNNADNSDDIRDVSITRMAMVRGYYWDIDSGKNVTGQEIIRNVRATEASAIKEALESGKKVTLTGNVSAGTALEIEASKDIYLDLGGNTLTVASFSVESNSRSTITIKNGTIVTTAGITISAPYGNVVLENLTGYDANGLVNLAAANHSLHLDGAVKFYKGVAEPTPASIKVEKGTHIVVEENAVLEVASIVVTKDNFTTDASADTTAKISISSYSSSVTVANVETKVSGHVEKKENGIYSLADLQNAALVGGSYVLEANIETTDPITFNENITIEGNEHIFKVKVAGSAEVTIRNAHIMNLTVAEVGGFTGTLVFDGGILNTDSNGTEDKDAAFYSRNNPNASFVFRNMKIGANITKGIKIYNATAVVIDHCEFDASKLTIMQGGSNSSIQSLSLIDIQIDVGTPDITITNSTFTDAPHGSTSVPAFVDASGTLADSDTGAAIKLKVEKGAQFGSVTITGNTFARNYRDILVGTAPYANLLQEAANNPNNGRTGDGLRYNAITGWTISGNTTTLTSEVVANRGVATLSHTSITIDNVKYNKYTTYVDNVGEIVGGAGIWTVNKVFENIDGTWYYVENGTVYAVSVVSGKAVLTPVVVSTEQELLNAMQNENCHFVVLNEDIDVSSQILVTRDVKLDLNGKKVTYVGETELKSGIFGVKRGGTLTINDTVGTGVIDARVNAYAAVILTVSGESATGEKAKVVVNGGMLEGYYYGITGNGSRHNTELVVNNGILYGVNGSGIYNPQDGSVLVNNGSIKGFGSAIEIRAGQLEINGGVFEALTNKWVATGNGSGTTIEGAIIAISQHTTNKNITVTINDGTFTNGIRSLVMYDTVNTGRSERMNVTINGGSFNSVSNKDTVTIMARNGNLVINGGNFNSGADNNGEGCSTVYAVNHGQVTINDGTFKASAKYSGRYWTLNIYNGSTGTASMTVRGGEYEDFDPSHPNTDDNVTYVENGYVVSSQIVDEKTIYTVSAE